MITNIHFFSYDVHATLQFWRLSLLYKAILSVCMYVRGLFAPTAHRFQDTAIWLILVDPKC